MKLENTERLLKRFNYSYHKNDQELVVNMELSHRISIDFSNPENIVITDKLVAWNFLTGIFTATFKNAVLINLLIGLAISCVIAFQDTSIAMAVFIMFLLWITSWSMFYITRSETLKQLLINWKH